MPSSIPEGAVRREEPLTSSFLSFPPWAWGCGWDSSSVRDAAAHCSRYSPISSPGQQCQHMPTSAGTRVWGQAIPSHGSAFLVARSSCPIVPHLAVDIPSAVAGISRALFAATAVTFLRTFMSSESRHHACLALASSSRHPKALYFSAIAASRACCPLPCLSWGGWERGAGGCPAAVVVKPVIPGSGTGMPNGSPSLCGEAGCAGRGGKGAAEGAGGHCCCCCSRDAARVFFCLCFFPRAGAVRLSSREVSPRRAGMNHQLY